MDTETSTKKDKKGIKITKREVAILSLVLEYRFLTAEQIATYFEQDWYAQSYLNSILISLTRSGYLTRPENAPNTRFYMLGEEGVRTMETEHGLDLSKWTDKSDRLSAWSFRPHEVGIRDYMISLEVKHKRGELILTRQSQIARNLTLDIKPAQLKWKTQVHWKGEVGDVTVLPDWVYGVADPKGGETKFEALELDMATETVNRVSFSDNKSVLKTILAYAHSFESGEAEDTLDLPNLRTRFITTGKKRKENMQSGYQEYAEILARPNRFLFSLTEDMTPDKVLTGVENGAGRAVSVLPS